MKKWSHIDHTADICILLTADSLADLFAVALQAMNEILYPGFCTETNSSTDHSELVEIEAIDQTVLLVDFLSEALGLSHEMKMIFCELNIHSLKNNKIKASIKGLEADRFMDDIKAVTYHEADIKKDREGNWTTHIIFDI